MKSQHLRLLLVGDFSASVRGNRSVMEDLAARLRGAGHDLICASPFRNGWVRGAHMLATAALWRSQYDLAVVDLFSGRAFRWGAAVSAWLSVCRCPFVLVLRGGALPDYARCWPVRVKACLRRAAAVVAPSRYLLEQMRPYRDDLVLLSNPLDVRAYGFRRRDHPQPRLIWLRGFHQIYNPFLAPKVVARLTAGFPAVQLTMVGADMGDGSLRRTQELAIKLGVENRMTLPGGVPKVQVPTWLNSGDIFLNTTNVDNTPISVLEAMACGLPVVSTRVGGIPYLLEDERDALLVPPDDPDAMADAVYRLLTEAELAKGLSHQGRVKVEGLDWSVVLPQWEGILAGVAARHLA